MKSILNNRLLLFFATGLLFFLSWPVVNFSVLAFVAFVPLLFAEQKFKNVWAYSLVLYTNFLVWNVLVTWWIKNASIEGAIGAILCNAALMCLPWIIYRITKSLSKTNLADYSIIFYWLAFEYLHLDWELSWSWLNLGNVFSNTTFLIQWYEYTGVLGGTLWILVVNYLIYQLLQNNKFNKKKVYLLSGILIIPALASLVLLQTNKELTKVTKKENVIIVQPNEDPYTEKFRKSEAELIDELLRLTESNLDENTALVIWPETAIPANLLEDEISSNMYYQPIFEFARKHPGLMIVTGINSAKIWKGEKKGFSVRSDHGMDYEVFNTAMKIEANSPSEFYHKNKLVPGVESLPSWLGFLSDVFSDFGGTSGTLGRSEEPLVFKSRKGFNVAPVICYESIYGEYVGSFINKGANLIAVITNDGWWGDTPGYKQHLSYSRLRAIESRKWLVRSANTGISAVIDPLGNILESRGWNQQAVIRHTVQLNEESTIYTKFGDWIGKIAFVLGIFIFIYLFTCKYFLKK
ncbi:apolipoprotein N-acyltransferase [Polluticaenibacter yanchengensis]|uniref:Apolipoprotein N-acyltransferase n=1 Tax=Polluticaenibacter yanchengensis TaxID=3014562 RepID=A0ABT4UN42_9BACT|nr:apolipoprotein N-acyltransferase [Chitinophagaceae bacterium LY-5]